MLIPVSHMVEEFKGVQGGGGSLGGESPGDGGNQEKWAGL